jgi:14-3-3 protein epsilon
MTDRDLKFFMARVADQAERYSDVLANLNTIISADAALNSDERNLLSVAYKALTGSRRTALRTILAFLDDDSIKAIPERVAQLNNLKTKLVGELD